VLPWSDWAQLGPAGALFVAAVLLVRRPPIVVAFARPLRIPRRDAAFMGWFGPIGVSAIFYLAHAMHEGVDDPRLFAAGTLAVTSSVVAFWLTSSPGRRLYARDRTS
jgi:NhaP-type Na+/H+ or K+/H+ antiporter